MRGLLYTLVAAGLVSAGCGDLGKVQQGRVIAYDKQTKQVTLILEAADGKGFGVLPPVTVAAPTDPSEMGPAPAAGGLMKLDAKSHRLVIYNASAGAFQTVTYNVIGERRDVSKAVPPVVDQAGKTISVYSAADHSVITFAGTDDLLRLPAGTWRQGDVVRYYYKDPAQALRLMNVTKTDLSKSG